MPMTEATFNAHTWFIFQAGYSTTHQYACACAFICVEYDDMLFVIFISGCLENVDCYCRRALSNLFSDLIFVIHHTLIFLLSLWCVYVPCTPYQNIKVYFGYGILRNKFTICKIKSKNWRNNINYISLTDIIIDCGCNNKDLQL